MDQSDTQKNASLNISRKQIQKWQTLDKSPKRYPNQNEILLHQRTDRTQPMMHDSGESDLVSIEQESIVSANTYA